MQRGQVTGGVEQRGELGLAAAAHREGVADLERQQLDLLELGEAGGVRAGRAGPDERALVLDLGGVAQHEPEVLRGRPERSLRHTVDGSGVGQGGQHDRHSRRSHG